MEIINEDSRFYTKTANGQAELAYRIEGEIMSIYHTFVPEEERGKGIAEQLALKAFELAIKKNLKVLPDCSYIVHFIEKHKELKQYVFNDESDE